MNDIEKALSDFDLRYERVADRFYKILNPREINLYELADKLTDGVMYCHDLRHKRDKNGNVSLIGDLQFISDNLKIDGSKVKAIREKYNLYDMTSYGYGKKVDSVDTLFEKGVDY